MYFTPVGRGLPRRWGSDSPEGSGSLTQRMSLLLSPNLHREHGVDGGGESDG